MVKLLLRNVFICYHRRFHTLLLHTDKKHVCKCDCVTKTAGKAWPKKKSITIGTFISFNLNFGMPRLPITRLKIASTSPLAREKHTLLLHLGVDYKSRCIICKHATRSSSGRKVSGAAEKRVRRRVEDQSPNETSPRTESYDRSS